MHPVQIEYPDNRLPGLDGLRAISAFMVILAHMGLSATLVPDAGLRSILEKGGFGVNIFFVISGFIITHLLLREEAANGRFSLRRFYVRRGLRILPPAYFYLLVVTLLSAYHVWESRPADLMAAALFFRNMCGTGTLATSHFWSLAIEEQFYLIWPVTLLFLSPGWRLPVLGGLCAFAPLYRHVNMLIWPATSINWMRLDLIYDTLLTGALLALLWHRQETRQWLIRIAQRSGLLLAGFAAAILASFILPRYLRPGFNILTMTVQNISVAGIIAVLISSQSRSINAAFNWPALVSLGKASFSLYLWQQLVTLSPLRGGWMTIPASAAILLTFTAFSYYFIEQPALKYRNRLIV